MPDHVGDPMGSAATIHHSRRRGCSRDLVAAPTPIGIGCDGTGATDRARDKSDDTGEVARW